MRTRVPYSRHTAAPWAAADGQTTTEYLMVTGVITAVGLMVMQVMQAPYQQFLQDLMDWLLNG